MRDGLAGFGRLRRRGGLGTRPGGAARPRGRAAGLLAVASLLLLATPAAAEEAGAPVRSRIVNGLPSQSLPTTGALLVGTGPDDAFPICSGTLIGCQTFLTAAHCVCDTDGADCTGANPPDPSGFLVFLQHAGFVGVTRIALRPDYVFPVADLAVLELASPVTRIAPTPINTTADPPFGTSGLIAGFGVTSGVASDGGIKRAGAVVTGSCPPGVSEQTSVCWSFDNPLGPPGTDSNTCFGDSGGPLFADLGAGEVVAGITSGGLSGTCLPSDRSYDTNVWFYRDTILAEGGPDLANTRCGSGTHVDDPGAAVFAFSGTLSGSGAEARHSFAVPAGTEELRVTLGGAESADLDLYLRAGTPPTTSAFDCAAAGVSPFGACTVTSPAAGSWHVLVTRFAGSGEYQVTASVFGPDCADPANEGLPCDDGSSCTTGDVCQSGTCTGTPLPDGAGCDDGSACTPGDTCQAGVCVPGPAPVAGCRLPVKPGKGLLRILDRGKDARDRLVWRWAAGAATDLADFGDPTAGDPVALCAYDESVGAPQRIFELAVPPGAFWAPVPGGYLYRDPDRSLGGLKKLLLKSGPDGRAKVVFVATGAALDPPRPPLFVDPRVRLQLLTPTACFENTFSAPLQNELERFKARSD